MHLTFLVNIGYPRYTTITAPFYSSLLVLLCPRCYPSPCPSSTKRKMMSRIKASVVQLLSRL